MQFDHDTKLMHFSDDELEELGEARTPIDWRVAGFILARAERNSAESSKRLSHLYSTRANDPDQVSTEEIDNMRAEGQRLATLVNDLVEVTELAGEDYDDSINSL